VARVRTTATSARFPPSIRTSASSTNRSNETAHNRDPSPPNHRAVAAPRCRSFGAGGDVGWTTPRPSTVALTSTREHVRRADGNMKGNASLVPPIVVHGLEVQTVSPQRAVPPLRQARGPPRQCAYRHLDGADDGSEDNAGTDRGMSVAWSPAVQRPLNQGVERLTCSPTPEPTIAEVPVFVPGGRRPSRCAPQRAAAPITAAA
jgi:hypothetical protein